MMRARPYRYSRWPVCGYTLGLLGLWVAVAAVWSRVQPPAPVPAVPAVTRIRFVGDPGPAAPDVGDLLVFMRHPDGLATQMPAEAGPGEIPRLEAHPRFMALGQGARPAVAAPRAADLAAQAERRLAGYTPTWPVREPFPVRVGERLRYVVEPGTGLAAGGFAIPAGALEAVDGGEQPWDMTVDIVCGEDGPVRDVVVLDEGGLSGAQSNVVRLLQLAGAEGACRGRLTVRWARVPEAREERGRTQKSKGKG